MLSFGVATSGERLFRSLLAIRLTLKRFYSSKPPVCIVGSGPSAFYVAQFLLRHHTSACVDMYEKLPAPFGLVRYGVAPDHAEVKNVINTFTEVARNPRFRFFGNVNVGKDVRLHELQRAYGAVILAYGASVDRHLCIPGENLSGVIAAKDFVGWYNGLPGLSDLRPDFDCDTAVVIGVGNVAIDIARILLSKPSVLKPVISHLISSNIRRVVLVARRGPLQAAFTLKELRELSRLDIGEESSTPHYLPINFLPPGIINDCFPGSEFNENLLQGLPRSRRRLMKFLSELSSKQNYRCSSKRCDIQFLRSPVRIIPTDETRTSPLKSSVRAVELAVNQLVGAASENQDICTNPDAPTEVLECGLVIRSIGYRSVPIDPDLPFDTSRGVIKSKDHRGRVADPEGGGSLNPTLCPLYCSGWVKRGAVGVIAETSVDARITAQTVLVDLATAESQSDPRVTDRHGSAAIEQLLRARGVLTITFSDWERVDAMEKAAGKALGKPREKLTSIESILKAAFPETTCKK